MHGPTLALVSHADPRGIVAPHVVHLVRSLSSIADEVVLVSGSGLVSGAGHVLDGLAEVVENQAARHAVARWRHGLAVAGSTLPGLPTGRGLRRLLLADDAVVGPFRTLTEVFPDGHRGLRGVARSSDLHGYLERFVLDLGTDVLERPEHDGFWQGVADDPARTRPATRPGTDQGPETAARLVVDLERWVRAAGLPVDAVYEPSDVDRLHIAAHEGRRAGRVLLGTPSRRSASSATARARSKPAAPLRKVLTELRRPSDVTALAWRAALDGRLPFLRLEVLARSGAALEALEARHPDALAGVREHLRRLESRPALQTARGGRR